MAFTRLKIVVFAPIPRARINVVMIAKPGCLMRVRLLERRSCNRLIVPRLCVVPRCYRLTKEYTFLTIDPKVFQSKLKKDLLPLW